MKTHRTTRQAGFADTDAAGFVHFSRLFCFVEELEHAVLASAGFPVLPLDAAACLWPRVACSAEFLSPPPAMKPLDVVLELKHAGERSLTWRWRIEDGDACVARGEMKTVCCVCGPEGLKPRPLPAALRAALSESS